jgi:tetratricopeptide (TPR) repeat protein/DNA-binding CsgD family transcriptional regulator
LLAILKMLIRLLFFVAFSFQLSLHASVFDTLKTVKSENRISLVNYIFFNKVLKLDSTKALTELNDLIAYSKSINDVELEIIAIQAKGYYYFNRMPEKTNLGIEHYRKVIELANKAGLRSREAKVLNQLGFYLFLNVDFKKGFEYLLRSDRLMQNVGYHNIEKVSFHLYNIAFAYSEFKNYSRSISYFEKALEYSDNDSIVIMKLNNELGLLYLKQERLNEALICFENTYKIARNLKDTFHIGLASGNLGDAFLKLGKKDTAIYLLNQDYKLSMQVKNWRSACLVQLLLLELDLDKKNLESAINRMKDVKKLMELLTLKSGERLADYLDSKIWLEYYKQQSNLNFHKENFKEAFLYLDSFVVINDSIVNQNDANMLVNFEIQIMAEKYLYDLDVLDKERKLQKVIRNSTVIFLLLVILFIVKSFYSLKQRKKKEKEILILEKNKSETELQTAKKELHLFMTSLKEKNSIIEQFQREIEYYNKNTNPDIIKGREDALEKLSNVTILTEEGWKKFRRMFDDVHKGFFQRLSIKFPDLTVSEVRLLVLIKLDLSNHEIASMLGISTPSVRKTSLRLRKKLEITSHSDLFEFVESI